MKVSAYRCDGDNCKKLRVNDTDRWWVIAFAPEPVLRLMPWEYCSETEIDDPNALHACGQACAMKMISAHIGVMTK